MLVRAVSPLSGKQGVWRTPCPILRWEIGGIQSRGQHSEQAVYTPEQTIYDNESNNYSQHLGANKPPKNGILRAGLRFEAGTSA